MRYKPDSPREDNPAGVMAHAGKYDGGVALVVLGGQSAADWMELYSYIRPDVLIGCNGANVINGLDYWLLSENMTRSNNLAKRGDSKSARLMEMFRRATGAKYKMVSHWSFGLLEDTDNCVSIRRQGYESEEIADWFRFRDYGLGLLAGWLQREKGAGAPVHVGTVGAQALHLAGILGVSEVHTIGFDLILRDREKHHWYNHPVYEVDRFRTPAAFQTYKGIPTLQTWIESAQFLKSIEWMFERDGLQWLDHSNGLLSLFDLKSTKGIR